MTRRSALLVLLLCLAPLQEAAASRPKTTLAINSTPPGASVTIDGEPRGKTPLTVRGLARGSHTIEVAKEGFVASRRDVTLRGGKRKTLKFRLEAVQPLDRAEKDRRRQAASGVTPPLGHIGLLSRMFLGSSGFVDRGGFAGAAGTGVLDPISGMWVVTTVDFDDLGQLVITADYFLDEALTEPAGGFVIVADGLNSTATYAFTAGELAGQTGTLIATVLDLQHMEIQAQGEMPQGWSYTGDFNGTLTQTGFTLTGTITLTDPEGGTTEWDVEMTLVGATFTGAVGNIEVVAQFNQDGSGEATLTDTATDEVLALVVWDAEGTATITYSDGSSEVFQLF